MRKNTGYLLRGLVSAFWLASCSSSRDPVRQQEPVSTTQTAVQRTDTARLAQMPNTIPMTFEQNLGQFDRLVHYAARGPGYGVYLTQDAIVVGVQTQHAADPNDPALSTDRIDTSAFRMRWVGATRPAIVQNEQRAGHQTNYLIGNDPRNWRRGVSSFGRVTYKGIYEGVDLAVYGQGREMEYDFIVAPNRDPSVIGLKMDGVQGVSLDADGNLQIRTTQRTLTQHKPVVYQTLANGSRRSIEGRYALASDGTVHFQVGEYDHSRALVIDPILSYGSYLGGAGSDFALGIDVDSSGAIYVVGSTLSSAFPVSSAYDGTYNGTGNNQLGDAFVTKYNANFASVAFSTYIGGAKDETFSRVVVDSAGRAHMSGTSNSTDFPTQSPYSATFGGGAYDAVLTVLNAAGNGLTYSTYLGGASDDRGQAIALDPSGNVYLVGTTQSDNFPTLSAYQTARGGNWDAFFAKFSPLGASLTYSTYFGGSSIDRVYAVAADSSGNAYVAGNTNSSNLPTSGASQASYGGGGLDAFAAKMTASGGLSKSTYLGGVGDDSASSVALDSAGDFWVVGSTSSSNFPTTTPYQSVLGGGTDGFITKLGGSLLDRKYGSFLGGASYDAIRDIAFDSTSSIVLGGETQSTNFPTYNGAQATYGGGTRDGFLTQMASGGGSLTFSTYLGGSDVDLINAVATDSSNNIYVAGWTFSSNVPTSNALQTASGGEWDAIVGRYSVTSSISLTTDQASYSNGADVVLTYSGMAGNQYDWISVAAVGTPATSFEQFFFSGSNTSGTHTFSGLPGGTYEIRAYYNNTYNIEARSAPFTIATSFSVTVSTDKQNYLPGENVAVTFANMPGNQYDWISIAPSNAPAGTYTAWQYTGGVASGTLNFANLPNGTYVARAFFNNGYVIQGESLQFNVAPSSVTLTTDASDYATPATIVVTYSGMPAGNAYDWIAIAPAGSAASTVTAYQYTGGNASGTMTFTLNTPGTYVIRAFPNWVQGGYQYVVGSESTSFNVTNSTPPTLTVDKSTYTTTENIVVTYSNMAGNQYDWIALAVEGSAPDSPAGATQWAYTFGATNGTLTFNPLPAGTYRVRAFFSWPSGGYNVQGQSASTFVVQ